MMDMSSSTLATKHSTAEKPEGAWRSGASGRFAHPSNNRDAQLTRELGEVASDFLRECGFGDVVVTPAGANGGIDVVSVKSVAHVKVVGNAIVRSDVERLAGFAAPGSKRAVCFSMTGYSSAAYSVADALGVALFRFTDGNELDPVNDESRRLLLASTELDESDFEGSTREARRARRAARRAELDESPEASERERRSVELDSELIDLQQRARVLPQRRWRRSKLPR